jgi:hypothetical protein
MLTLHLDYPHLVQSSVADVTSKEVVVGSAYVLSYASEL